MAQAFEQQAAIPDIAELSFDDRLGLLLEREKTDREQRRCQGRRHRNQLDKQGWCPYLAPGTATTHPGCLLD